MTANRLPSQERYMALASRCDQLAATARTEGDRKDYLQRASVWRRLGAARLPEGSQQSPFQIGLARGADTAREPRTPPTRPFPKKGSASAWELSGAASAL